MRRWLSGRGARHRIARKSVQASQRLGRHPWPSNAPWPGSPDADVWARSGRLSVRSGGAQLERWCHIGRPVSCSRRSVSLSVGLANACGDTAAVVHRKALGPSPGSQFLRAWAVPGRLERATCSFEPTELASLLDERFEGFEQFVIVLRNEVDLVTDPIQGKRVSPYLLRFCAGKVVCIHRYDLLCHSLMLHNLDPVSSPLQDTFAAQADFAYRYLFVAPTTPSAMSMNSTQSVDGRVQEFRSAAHRWWWDRGVASSAAIRTTGQLEPIRTRCAIRQPVTPA
ncbi:hypothetical protein QF030_000363 [Streptomyces rishiriensis]|uniref:Uncharacterized protein n=1 Tax=Streptomyces rishiriensis TaxID=68264 RepID=A0ABU0NHY3_STRRH|nr:hypothetical protein [Streptomyces rishiriensis]